LVTSRRHVVAAFAATGILALAAAGSLAARPAIAGGSGGPTAIPRRPELRADGGSCADFKLTSRLDHRRRRFIVSEIRVPSREVTCAAAEKTIKRLIRTHSVPGLKCEVGRPTWDAEDHSYWSGYCLDPGGGKTTWQVEEFQLATSTSALPGPVAEGMTSCSNAGTPEDLFLADITTRRVSCKAARRFIVALHASWPDFKKEVTHFRGFTCSPSPEGFAVYVRCVEGRRLIRWLNGT
jgi:hypothetical protein